MTWGNHLTSSMPFFPKQFLVTNDSTDSSTICSIVHSTASITACNTVHSTVHSTVSRTACSTVHSTASRTACSTEHSTVSITACSTVHSTASRTVSSWKQILYELYHLHKQFYIYIIHKCMYTVKYQNVCKYETIIT